MNVVLPSVDLLVLVHLGHSPLPIHVYVCARVHTDARRCLLEWQEAIRRWQDLSLYQKERRWTRRLAQPEPKLPLVPGPPALTKGAGECIGL